MYFPVFRIVSCHMHIVMGDCWKLLTKTGRRTSYLTTVCRWTALTLKHSSAFTQITRDHRERKILLSNRVEIHWFKYSQQSSWQMPVRSFRTESLFGEWPRSTSFNLVSQLLSRVNIGSSFIKIIEWCHISKSGCYSWQSPLETKVAMLSKGIREQLWVRVSPSFIVQTQPFDPVCIAQIIELPCLSYATLNCITRGKRGESPWVPTSPYPMRNIILIQPRTVYKTIWVYLVLYIVL